MPLLQASYYSYALHMNCSATVIIPQESRDYLSRGPRLDADGKVPVLWLLHECGGDHTSWQRYTNIERYAAARGIAVVMPGVLSQCFYADMPQGLPYFQYISEELPQLFRQMFPQLSTLRESSFIAGVSMGGYGALKTALTNPERYAAAGCFSSGNLIEIRLPRPERCDEFLRTLYGVPRNALNTSTMADALGTPNDLRYLLDQAVGSGRPLPKIMMYCGAEDFMLSLSDAFAEYIREKAPDAPLICETRPGAHNWDFWDSLLPVFLDSCGLTPML